MMIQSISRAQGFLTIIAGDVKSRTEVEFVHAVSAGGSVKFLPAVSISPFSLIFCVFPTKTVEIR